MIDSHALIKLDIDMLDSAEAQFGRLLWFTLIEGGEWLPYADRSFPILNGFIHSLKFADGTEWDVINGIRPKGLD